MRIYPNRLCAAIAVALTLAVHPLAAQRKPLPAPGSDHAINVRLARSDLATLGMYGDRPALLNDDRAAVIPPTLACAGADGACGRSVAKHTFAGAAAGAGVALVYAFAVCLPRAFAPERRGCSGAVPVVAVGSGAIVGLISGFASRHCRGGE